MENTFDAFLARKQSQLTEEVASLLIQAEDAGVDIDQLMEQGPWQAMTNAGGMGAKVGGGLGAGLGAAAAAPLGLAGHTLGAGVRGLGAGIGRGLQQGWRSFVGTANNPSTKMKDATGYVDQAIAAMNQKGMGRTNTIATLQKISTWLKQQLPRVQQAEKQQLPGQQQPIQATLAQPPIQATYARPQPVVAI